MHKNECTRNCWIAAAVVGLLVWIFVSFIGHTSVLAGLFLGLITAVLLGLFLVWALCRGSGSPEDDRQHSLPRGEAARPAQSTMMPLHGAASDSSRANAPTAAAGASSGSAASAPAAATPATSAPVTAAAPAKPAPKAQEPAPAPAPRPVKAEAPAPEKKAPEKKAPEKPAEKAADKKPAAKKAEAAAPKAAKPAKAKADDLKEIKGVGPKLEQLLHENGVTTFAQIAEWTEAQIDAFAEKIGSMGGRIRSDDWVAQAKTLAAGGTTEHAQKVKKGEIT